MSTTKRKLVIVESPTKAKLISSFLPKEFQVVASNGHIRDLPVNKSEIPDENLKRNMEVIGVIVEKDGCFKPIYVVSKGKKKAVQELKRLEKTASEIFLATDEDREGESIGWHILDELKISKPVKRLAFHEITKNAILQSLEKPRSLDLNLVKAQEARRVLDRLYGYLISPLLWRKITKGLSAGRVQSVALRLLVEREEERMRFRPAKYWSVEATLVKENTQFSAKLHSIDGVEVASSKHFDPDTGVLSVGKQAILLNEKIASEIVETLKSGNLSVTNIESKEITLKTPSPFVTSTLQQEANRRFGFSPRYTMNLAQKLYENGFITYMRTDSTHLSQEALYAIRSQIRSKFGEKYLSEQVKVYKSSVKNAQEAHEAIRPIFSPFTDIGQVEAKLGADAGKLYALIVNRTLASQMTDAKINRRTVTLTKDNLTFKATGRSIVFDGYLKVFNTELEEQILPPLSANDTVSIESVSAKEHQTQPPNRFTEGTLVRELEKRGIGRPSTWASIVDLVTKREYAFKKGNSLVPTFLSFTVVRLLRKHFPELIDYEFTAKMEDALDEIASGKRSYNDFLSEFYFGNNHRPGLKQLLERNLEEIDSKDICMIPVALDGENRFWVRVGKSSISLTDGNKYIPLPMDTVPDQLTSEYCKGLFNRSDQDLNVGGKEVSEKYGPYGRYLEIAEGRQRKRISLRWLKDQPLTEDILNFLIQVPIVLGHSSILGGQITIEVGRYGPFLKCGSKLKTIPLEKVQTISFEEAEQLLIDSRNESQILGYDAKNTPVYLKRGRYGYYLKYGRASFPLKGVSVNDLDFEKAMELIKSKK